MYYLMNKDVIVASVTNENGIWKVLHQKDVLPIGNFEINEWLEDRKASTCAVEIKCYLYSGKIN